MILTMTGLLFGCKEVTPVESSLEKDSLESKISEPIQEDKQEVLAEIIDLSEDFDLFVVIAGAYSSKAGAESKALQLREQGFKNASVIQRDGSKLFSTLVERFDNEEDANAFAKDLLSNEKIKSYVYQLN